MSDTSTSLPSRQRDAFPRILTVVALLKKLDIETTDFADVQAEVFNLYAQLSQGPPPVNLCSEVKAAIIEAINAAFVYVNIPLPITDIRDMEELVITPKFRAFLDDARPLICPVDLANISTLLPFIEYMSNLTNLVNPFSPVNFTTSTTFEESTLRPQINNARLNHTLLRVLEQESLGILHATILCEQKRRILELGQILQDSQKSVQDIEVELENLQLENDRRDKEFRAEVLKLKEVVDDFAGRLDHALEVCGSEQLAVNHWSNAQCKFVYSQLQFVYT
ncbi:hypothetical protein D9758_015912 [Tetrapyrgos nigripes]|uniref:Uncharacterized protein n=1 Tax=Tetrapyrgos nigripes TaxID=182062 RepID=A0A8H5FNB9_9AGAR|nr:hypothetical protein D9758_015912 [Tetrapyrgos nigripes]